MLVTGAMKLKTKFGMGLNENGKIVYVQRENKKLDLVLKENIGKEGLKRNLKIKRYNCQL